MRRRLLSARRRFRFAGDPMHSLTATLRAFRPRAARPLSFPALFESPLPGASTPSWSVSCPVSPLGDEPAPARHTTDFEPPYFEFAEPGGSGGFSVGNL